MRYRRDDFPESIGHHGYTTPRGPETEMQRLRRIAAAHRRYKQSSQAQGEQGSAYDMRRRHYGRDLSSKQKTWIGAGAAALALGAAAFFMSKKASAAPSTPVAPPLGPPAQPTPTPVVPPTPVQPPDAPPVVPPVPTNASLAKVVTHDPPPGGDLNVFDRPNGSRTGGAEKDSIVNVLSNDGTWAQIHAPNPGGRYPEIVGFVHAKFLGDPLQTATEQLGQTAIDAADALKSALGF
jgi:hypothetical protein